MREVVFTAELKGTAAPVEGAASTLRARTSGKDPSGRTISFESEVVLSENTFKESGTIAYEGSGKVTFETVGVGCLEPSPIPTLQRGAVIWTVTRGDGEYSGATGYITSNFTVSAAGDVVDNHYVRLFVP